MTIIKIKRYWNRQPCNLKHSAAEVGSLQYSREVTQRKHLIEPHIPHFAQYGRWKNKRVLEFGCGIGTDAIEFARSGAFVYAIDLSTHSLAVARQRLMSEGIPVYPEEGWQTGVFLRHANIQTMNWTLPERESYDLVYSFGVLHHTPKPEWALVEARRAIKPTGELRIMVYNPLSWKVFWIIMTYGKGQFWKWKSLIPKHSEAQTGCPITHVWPLSIWRRLLQEAGFSISDTWVDHIFPYRVPEYRRYEYVRAFPWNLITGRPFRALERLFGWHRMIVARPT